MKKVKLLIAAMVALLLCAAMFAGCGKKEEEGKQAQMQEATEYKEGYMGDPIDENGNQGEYIEYLPGAFGRPAVENLEDETIFYDDIQEEEYQQEESWEDLPETGE